MLITRDDHSFLKHIRKSLDSRKLILFIEESLREPTLALHSYFWESTCNIKHIQFFKHLASKLFINQKDDY